MISPCCAANALALLRPRRERPPSCRAAERAQQFPPSDGDCHTPLPCEVRKGTIPRHERAVFTFNEGGVGRCGSERRRILPAHGRADALEIEHGQMGTSVRKTLAQTGALSTADRAAL